jgi:hypothetical protein
METLRRKRITSIALFLGLWFSASASVPGPLAEYERLVTNEAEADSQEFFELAASLKGDAPRGPNARSERQQ